MQPRVTAAAAGAGATGAPGESGGGGDTAAETGGMSWT